MKTRSLWVLLVSVILLVPGCGGSSVVSATSGSSSITLPPPQKDSDMSIEEALQNRRSVRSYNDDAVTLKQLGQLLWAAQGVTGPNGERTAPSAGALYPLKVYVVAGNVENLAAGLYVYEPDSHALVKLKDGDSRQSLSQAALNQASVRQAAIDIVITGNYAIEKPRYGDRAEQYTILEAGHAAQNICLQAVGLKMGVVTIGAYDDAAVMKTLGLPEEETVLYIIPAGNLPK